MHCCVVSADLSRLLRRLVITAFQPKRDACSRPMNRAAFSLRKLAPQSQGSFRHLAQWATPPKLLTPKRDAKLKASSAPFRTASQGCANACQSRKHDGGASNMAMFPFNHSNGQWYESPEPRPRQPTIQPQLKREWVRRGFFRDSKPMSRREVALRAANARSWLEFVLHSGPV